MKTYNITCFSQFYQISKFDQFFYLFKYALDVNKIDHFNTKMSYWIYGTIL